MVQEAAVEVQLGTILLLGVKAGAGAGARALLEAQKGMNLLASSGLLYHMWQAQALCNATMMQKN